MMTFLRTSGLLLALAGFAHGEPATWAAPGMPIRNGLEIWFDASRENEAREAHYMNRLANGDHAEIWHDASGHGRHVVQWTTAQRPRWNAGAMEFDGDDFLAGLLTPGRPLREATVFVVAAVPTPGGDFPALLSLARRGENDFTSGLCVDFGRPAAKAGCIDHLNVEGAGQPGETNLLDATLEAAAGHLFAIVLDANRTTVRVDGKVRGQRNRGSVVLAMDRMAVGARFVEPEMRHFLKGKIAEVLIFSRKLDEAEIVQMEAHLGKAQVDFLTNPRHGEALAPGKAPAPVQMLVPGFEVRELPVRTTNLNNIEYAPDGRLFAGGYDGRLHLLRDLDGDGLEEDLVTFQDKTSDDYPLGMVVKDGMPHVVLTDSIVRFRDTNGDGIPDRRETVASGWDDPKLRENPLLMHRRVDSAMALAAGPDGDWYVTMGSANPGNGYWQQAQGDAFATDLRKTGRGLYSPDKRRGCLLRIDRNGHVEQIASGLRYVMSLQWDRHGELFATDQEGATWLPNGNPFDELLHLEKGRHYGFPPRHPKLLPEVIDEPSVWDFTPQHQSACGFRFNGPAKDGARFGPEFWAHDALVTGESRGKLWRTKLAKTASGYVAMNEVIACLGLLVVDCAISPGGDLVICCHSGDPDWGSGPSGHGRLFKISCKDPNAAVPVLAWARSATESVVVFNRPLSAAQWPDNSVGFSIRAGRYVQAGDRFETMRPGYAVVALQQRMKPEPVIFKRSALSADRRNLVLETSPRIAAVNYAMASTDPALKVDVSHGLTGVEAAWRGSTTSEVSPFWLPHPDFTAARELTRGSAVHDAVWKQLESPGTLTLRGQLDLWKMLIPQTQPGSTLDHVPEPEQVTVCVASDAALTLYAAGAAVDQAGNGEARITVSPGREGKWIPFSLTLATPVQRLDVSFYTARDPRPRALLVRRFLLPFAVPPPPLEPSAAPPEIAGGNWNAGRSLFAGKAVCATCHRLRGQGVPVGPDLDNLVHRDYASVLADIVKPSAAINPDAAAYTVHLKDGTTVTGTRVQDASGELHIAQPGGVVAKLQKSEILQAEPLPVSLMPPGLDKILTVEELRDLMTYLLSENPEQPPGNGAASPP
ncbi:MAG: c-type cytochrome [Verrucomicrobiales bacterium]|nr:c-type cytochrome [Verrucomicrobiales bacterium]